MPNLIALKQLQMKLAMKNIKLIAVSKTKTVEEMLLVYNAGQRAFGENRALEMKEKYDQLPKDIEWHMIGTLQTNKVKYIAPFVSMIHSVDSLKLLEEIDRQAKKNNRVIECLLEIHIGSELSKQGLRFPPSPLTPLPNGEGNKNADMNEQSSSSLLPVGEGSGMREEKDYYTKQKLPKALLQFARFMRKESTDAESILWQLLRNRQLNGFKFRRQHPLREHFILDFYCRESKLGIELDGAVHDLKDQKEYDDFRTKAVAELGTQIIRFRNSEIITDAENVLQKILDAVVARSPSPVPLPELFPSPLTPLPDGEGDKNALMNDSDSSSLLPVGEGSGMREENELLDILKKSGDLKNIRICGLMGMATFTDDVEQVRKEFRSLRKLRDVLNSSFSNSQIFKFSNHLSIGMTSDYKIAIEEGSTMVRVGSLIFGERK